MQCPVCPDERLAITDRQGIEIDYCPSCRGIWLDRGELDKLIERASVEMARPAAMPAPASTQARVRDDDRYDDRDRYGKPKKKRSSFLGEILDF